MEKIKKNTKSKNKYSFLKNLSISILGTLIGMTIICLLFFSIIISLLTGEFPNQESTQTEANSILKIKFNYPIYDSPNNKNAILDNISLGQQETNNLNLYSILSAIELASKNKNVSGILLELDDFEGPEGFASLKEIRDGLKEFKKSGKFIWSYSKMLNQAAYYIASVSDSILIYPETSIDFRGLNITSVFLTETLNEFGITPEIIRSGKYKSAIETFTLKKMSPENKEQSQLILDESWHQILFDISIDRKISKNELNEVANNVLNNWSINKESILIDGQSYPQEVNNLLKEKINISTELNEFGLYNKKLSFVSLNDILDSSIESEEDDKIAIIYAEGEITDSDNNQISPKSHSKIIRNVKEDNNIKAVVLRVNSPGGSALASDMIWNELEQLKKVKPLIVSMGNVAASGGYYISCNADKIFASNSTITGSIGVFGLFFKMKDLLSNKLKLHFDEINTNIFSNFGNLNRLFSNEEKEILENLIDKTYSTFIKRVSNGRNESKENIHKIAQGRVWTGKAAKEKGLIDEIGGLNDAIKYASQKANITKYNIVEYPERKDFFDILLEEIQVNYSNYNNLRHLITGLKNDKIKQLILNKEGIQTRLPIDIEIN